MNLNRNVATGGNVLKNGSGKTIIYFLVLLWLAATGSYEGWQVRVLFAINGYLSAVILVWGGWSLARNGEKPLTRPLILFWLAGTLISALAGDPAAVARIFLYAILIAVYHIPHDLEALRRAAHWAGWLLFPLATFAPWENGNSLTMIIWGVYWLGVKGPGPVAGAYTVLAANALWANGSEGGMLAMLAGVAVWIWTRWPQRRRWYTWALSAMLGAAWILVLAVKLDDPGSFDKRVQMYGAAWRGFVHSPLIGNGWNTFDGWFASWHAIDAHNLLLTVLWETGLIGLAISAWLVYRLVTRHQFEPWAAAWLVTFASHSMIDLPLFASFFTAIVLFVIFGGLPCKGKITLAWPWLLRWPWSWPARLSRSRAQ